MSIRLFGLKNCSTCVKAQQWLNAHHIAFTFYDVRSHVPTEEDLRQWAAIVGWDKLINKRSQTWRALSEEQQSQTEEPALIALVQAFPSLMKRPLLENGQELILGFSEASYANADFMKE